MNIETANRLLQYRKQHKLSQEELAEKIGVSRQAVSKWERAEAAPDTDNLILLAKLYGVSLDELLRGKTDEKENSDARDEQSAQDERAGMGGPDENKTYHKARKVSFRNGIHVESEDGAYVHTNFKDGVNVIDHSGDRVHVGTDGIHVEENGSSRVYTDEDGNVMVEDDIDEHKHAVDPRHRAFKAFPIWAVALIGFLAWGFSGAGHGWALSWICFLAIPLYYSLIEAIFKRKPQDFAYPVLAAAVYIIFGFCGICGGWAMGWIVFLTIPIYYFICTLIHKH